MSKKSKYNNLRCPYDDEKTYNCIMWSYSKPDKYIGTYNYYNDKRHIFNDPFKYHSYVEYEIDK